MMSALHTLLRSLDAFDLTSIELLDALVFCITDAVPSWLRRVRTSTFVREIVSEFMLTDTDTKVVADRFVATAYGEQP